MLSEKLIRWSQLAYLKLLKCFRLSGGDRAANVYLAKLDAVDSRVLTDSEIQSSRGPKEDGRYQWKSCRLKIF